MIKHHQQNNYRRDRSYFLAKKFDNYEFLLSEDNEIEMHLKSYHSHWNKLGLEAKVERAVYDYNRYNPGYLVHAAGYIRLTDYHRKQKYIFSVNF